MVFDPRCSEHFKALFFWKPLRFYDFSAFCSHKDLTRNICSGCAFVPAIFRNSINKIFPILSWQIYAE